MVLWNMPGHTWAVVAYLRHRAGANAPQPVEMETFHKPADSENYAQQFAKMKTPEAPTDIESIPEAP